MADVYGRKPVMLTVIAVLGAIQAYGLSRSTHLGTATPDELARSLQSAPPAAGAGSITSMADVALQHSLHLTFTALFFIALSSVVFTVMVPSVPVSRAIGVPAEWAEVLAC